MQLLKPENLILGRIKQGWIENRQNDLNIEYFTAGVKRKWGMKYMMLFTLHSYTTKILIFINLISF